MGTRVGRGVWFLFGVLSAVGCIAKTDERGFPLYPSQGRQLASSEVAELVGLIESVDGVHVTERRRAYELLPGCHTVTSAKSWGGVDMFSGSTAQLPAIPFAITMRASYTYVIDIQQVSVTGSGGSLEITALEQDSEGRVT